MAPDPKVPSGSSARSPPGLWLKHAEPPTTRHQIGTPFSCQIPLFFFFFLSNSVAAGRRCLSRERAYAAFGRANIDLRNGFGGSSELYLIINTINAFLCRLQIFDLYSALEEDGSSPAFLHLISQRYLWLTSSKAEGMIPARWASDTDEK